jgi:hypothetical protein
VPAGSTLNADLSLSLTIGAFSKSFILPIPLSIFLTLDPFSFLYYVASTIPSGTSPAQVPSSVSVDYVRCHEYQVDSGDVVGGCDEACADDESYA